MIYDLIALSTQVLGEQKSDGDVIKPPVNFNDMVRHVSVHFDTPPQVLFVDRNFRPVSSYDQLTPPQLSPEDQVALDQARQRYEAELAEAKKSNKLPKFYNGKNFLLTGLYYDSDNDVIGIQANRIDFWFVRAIQENVFPYRQQHFTMGVEAPCISWDGFTHVMERSSRATPFFSAVAGFVEAKSQDEPLTGLLQKTAKAELKEELLGDARVPFSSDGPRAISFASANIGRQQYNSCTVIFPTKVQSSSRQMLDIFKNSSALDRKEHTNKCFEVNLDPAKRDGSVTLSEGKPGVDYHDYTDYKKGEVGSAYRGDREALGRFSNGPSQVACAAAVFSESSKSLRNLPGFPYAKLFLLGPSRPAKSLLSEEDIALRKKLQNKILSC